MIRKLLLLATLLVLNISALVSCGGAGTCIGLEPPKNCATFKAIDVRSINTITNSDLGEEESITFDELSIEVSIKGLWDNSCITSANRLWGNSAYACSFSDDRIITDPVTSIEVYSNAAFDDGHSAGTNLAEYFSMPSIAELNAPHMFPTHTLELQQSPMVASVHTFTVKLILQSGSELVATTVPLKIEL